MKVCVGAHAWLPVLHVRGRGLDMADLETVVCIVQGTRRRYRRLFAEGEGGYVGSSSGCFPDFYSPQDFEDWLQGNYQSAHRPCCSVCSPFLSG